MKTETCCGADRARVAAYFVSVVGTFLIMAALVWAMYSLTRPEPVTQQRADERLKNLKALQAAGVEALNAYGWVDPTKGVARLPVARAVELTLEEWKNPAAARSNLIARVEKATEAPPKAPEKPSPYE